MSPAKAKAIKRVMDSTWKHLAKDVPPDKLSFKQLRALYAEMAYKYYRDEDDIPFTKENIDDILYKLPMVADEEVTGLYAVSLLERLQDALPMFFI